MTTHLPRGLKGAAIVVLLGLALASTASAAPLVYQSVEQLAERSDGCALARVVDERVHWNEARTLIVTTYTLEVEESLSGGVESGPILLHRLGGELDGLALGYDAMPVFQVGERAVVFMQRRAPGAYIVSGLRQGVLHDQDGRFARDLRELRGAPALEESLDIDTLRTRIRAGTDGAR